MPTKKWLKQKAYFAKNPEAHERAKARHREWHKAYVAQGKRDNKANRQKYAEYYKQYDVNWRKVNKDAIKVARTLGVPIAEARELLCQTRSTAIATTTSTKPTTSTFGLAVKTGPKSSNEPKPTA